MGALMLSDWLDQLQLQHPVEIDLGLDRVTRVAADLDLLEAVPTTFTVAGTNGKGSVVEVLSSLLVGTGRSVGSYTSPHLLRFNERIRIDGHEASDRDIVEAFETIDRTRGDISLTYFEMATLAALWIFRDRDVDVQVLEVGLGGRLDAVNIIDAHVAVVTSIGLDHIDWLGDDLAQIAVEKAGVARADRPCVIAEGDPPASLRTRLDEIGAESLWVGRDWSVSDSHVTLSSGHELSLPPVSGLLPQNVGAAMEALYQSGLLTVDQLLTCSVPTLSVPGRLNRQLRAELDVVMDVAHNA
ncbi:MAG: bifunctional folylpolyglutamate synthase/dihydrofolate synthase, partial [Halieaceae bacterium]|nr:bifunctional folylpolyglutamate synthase/dihydrofolate synthase [Halieaceae bacterium]